MSRPPVQLHAKHPSFAATPPAPRAVVVLGFDDALLLNAAGPLEVFGAVPRLLAGAFAQHPPYRLVLASPEGGLISTCRASR